MNSSTNKLSKIADRHEWLQQIPNLVHFVLEDSQFVSLKELKFIKNSKVADKIDMHRIKLKAEAMKYISFEDFRADVIIFINNCRQTCSAEVIRIVDKLMDFINDEIHSIITCAECYNNAFLHPRTSFVILCQKPHLIIWAKPPGYNYWPAKVMNIEERMVHVRFFGDHSVFDVPAENCLLYSSTYPDKSKKCSVEGFTKALNEAKQYIQNIGAVYGAIKVTSSTAEPFEPTKWQDYLSDMIKNESHEDESDLPSPPYEKISNKKKRVEEDLNKCQQIEANVSKASSAKTQPADISNNSVTLQGHSTNMIHPDKSKNPLKRLRTTMDDHTDFSGDWCAADEKLIQNNLNKIFDDIKQCNAKSCSKIVELEEKLRSVTIAKDGLELELADSVNTMARERTESAKAKRDLEAKIKILEEENHALLKNISCKECGGKIKTIVFCSNECIENNIQRVSLTETLGKHKLTPTGRDYDKL